VGLHAVHWGTTPGPASTGVEPQCPACSPTFWNRSQPQQLSSLLCYYYVGMHSVYTRHWYCHSRLTLTGVWLTGVCAPLTRFDLADWLSTRANMQLSNEPGQSQFMLDLDFKVGGLGEGGEGRTQGRGVWGGGGGGGTERGNRDDNGGRRQRGRKQGQFGGGGAREEAWGTRGNKQAAGGRWTVVCS
jgi:hypothetical protein